MRLCLKPELQLSTLDTHPAAPGCICSKLGFRVWADARPGQTEGGRMETMLRTCAVGHWGFGVVSDLR